MKISRWWVSVAYSEAFENNRVNIYVVVKMFPAAF